VKSGKQDYDGGGVDEITFGMIEKDGVHQFLSKIRKDLLERNYHTQAILRVLIPKPGCKEKRPLGVPTIRDRVVQMAVKMMIEPVFEADFIETSYGFRPKKSAHDAIRIFRYTDDYVLMKKKHYPQRILQRMQRTLNRMGLKINQEKTRLLHISKRSFCFLGFEFRMIQSKFNWNTKRYTNIRPSTQSRSKLYAKISDCLGKRRHWTIEWMVYKLNEILIGWLNYFSITKVTHIWDTVAQIRWHLDYKLYKWLKSKGRKAHKTLRQRPFKNLVKYKNLLDIEKYASLKFHAKATR
jgi:hypothetical protein